MTSDVSLEQTKAQGTLHRFVRWDGDGTVGEGTAPFPGYHLGAVGATPVELYLSLCLSLNPAERLGVWTLQDQQGCGAAGHS